MSRCDLGASSADHILVVGAGHAGVQLIDSLRAGGYDGRLTLLSREAGPPYQRPPLSKDVIAGGPSAAPLLLRGAGFFDDARVDVRWGVDAERIARDVREVITSTGERLGYTTLILATGADSRRLDVPGEDLAGVFSLRTLDDARAASAALDGARRAVVVGAGFIGLEFAAGARARGVEVTLVSPTERPLRRVVSPAVSAYLAKRHTLDGVRLELGERVARLRESDGGAGRRRVGAVVTASGREFPADLVLVGVGAKPASGLASAAGLELAPDGGVAVDASLRSSDPAIFAIGDCSSFLSVHAGGRVRLESVQNATDQARYLASALLGADPAPYGELPWFWSHQGATKVQLAGLGRADAIRVVRGDVGAGRFSVFSYDGGDLVCVESVNSPADHLAARRLLAAGRSVDPTEAADPGFDLKAYSRAIPEAV